MNSPDASILLEQHDFLRRLARGLTRDDAAADDLAQETWVQALRRPPSAAESPRGWLAAVARNVARNQGRSERRRQDREARVAVPGEASVDARAEQLVSLQGDVAAALGRLSEPLRTAIVLRYYEDRAPAAIAEELGLPVETVRTRLKRGLAKLREDLDHRHGGDRAAWSLPLAGLAEVGGRTAALGATTGIGWMAVFAAVVALAAVGAAVAAAVSTGSPLEEIETARIAEAAGTPGSAAAPGAAPTPAAAEVGAASNAIAEEAQERSAITPRSAAEGAVVRGRVLDAKDAPIADALVRLSALPSWTGPVDGRNVREAAGRRIQLEARTAADGRFELRVPLSGKHVGVLRATKPLYVAAAWGAVTLTENAAVDVGDARLVPGGALRVQLRDAEGEPLTDPGWTARAKSGAELPGRSRPGYSTTAEVDEKTGTAFFEGLPAGPVELSLSHPLFKDGLEGRADVPMGETAALDLAYEGPPAATRLAVEFRGRTMIAARPASDSVQLDADGEPRVGSDNRGFGPFLFTDLEPGTYRVECTDPRFRPWSAMLETGRVHRADLVGAASVRFAFRDAKTGRELEPLAFTLELLATFKPSTVEVLARGGTFPASGVVEDLVAGRYTYELETEEYGLTRGRIDDLTAGPTRRVEIVLGEDRNGLVGRVVAGPDRVPVAGADVHVTAGERAGHLMGPGGSMMDDRGVVPAVDRSTKTDADGRFRFPSIEPGIHTLRVQRSPWFREDRTLTVTPTSGDEVLFALPEGATVRGVAKMPEGFDPTRIAFEAEASGDGDYDPTFGAMGMLRVRLEGDGRFEIGPLPPGVWTLGFGLAGEDVRIPGRGMSLPGSWSHFHDEDVTVIDGRDTEITVDLSARVPSEVRVDLGDGGLRPRDVVAWSWDLDANRLRTQRLMSATGGMRSAREPFLELGAVRPGRYRIVLVSRDGRWAYAAPDEFRFGVAETRTVEIDVTLERRTLEFRDAESDAPLGEVEVRWSLGLPASKSLARRKKPWTTDEAGRCEVAFPTSAVEISVEGYAPANLTWPTPAGDPHVVRLTKR